MGTITEDEGLAHGKVLADDRPPYVLGWRPRGFVVLPAQPRTRASGGPERSREDAGDGDGGTTSSARPRGAGASAAAWDVGSSRPNVPRLDGGELPSLRARLAAARATASGDA